MQNITNNDPVTAVIHIWTQFSAVTQPINYALMIDGYTTFGLGYQNELQKNFLIKTLDEEYDRDYKDIIKYTIKFIRMVNYCIVKKCTEKNTANRITYRGINASLFPNVEVGQTFRVMNFQCTSSELSTPTAFSGWNNASEEDKTLITFQIPEGCFNAGMIQEYACDDYKSQKETLIPPYTACKLTKKVKENGGYHMY